MARTSAERSLRGRVAVIGIGETDYYRHGASPDPEFKLALRAILAACADAGIDPRDIDGFASYSDDRSEASRLAAALGVHRLRSATMQWGGGGGGCCAAVANAAASIVAGLSDCVVVFRSLAQGQYGRFGQTVTLYEAGEQWWPTRGFEQQRIQPQQKARFVADVWEEDIARWVASRADVTVSEVAKNALRMTTERIGTADQWRIAATLENLGWERGKNTATRRP
jgi:acetyl-CoA acetyltransferase